jgi:hypothetical protein
MGGLSLVELFDSNYALNTNLGKSEAERWVRRPILKG